MSSQRRRHYENATAKRRFDYDADSESVRFWPVGINETQTVDWVSKATWKYQCDTIGRGHYAANSVSFQRVWNIETQIVE